MGETKKNSYMKYFIYQSGMTFEELTKDQFHDKAYEQRQSFDQCPVLYDKAAESMILFTVEYMRLMLPKEKSPTISDLFSKL